MPPRITAAVCAHNEAAVVCDAVASLLSQTLTAGACEILVIDNASTDGTAARLADLERRHAGRFRVVREEGLGLCNARNRALQEAAAPLVALIDADAVAEPQWLESIVEAFDRSPKVAAVGGPIRVQWDHPRPKWWDDRLDEALNHYDRGPEPHRLEYPRYPYGTNLAVRVAAAREIGGFCASLDRQGRNLRAGGDGELCLRLERGGWEVWYDARAVVHHRTTAGRLRRRYVMRRAFCHGRSQYLIERINGFESGRYLSWPRIAATAAASALRLKCDLPFLKYLTFRVGYHYERTFSAGRVGRDDVESGGSLQ